MSFKLLIETIKEYTKGLFPMSFRAKQAAVKKERFLETGQTYKIRLKLRENLFPLLQILRNIT